MRESSGMTESEWITRKIRIDKQLKSLNPKWKIIPYQEGMDTSLLSCHAIKEYPTVNGPADFALFVNGDILAYWKQKNIS